MFKDLRDCRYSAFISYAHDDDIAWRDWVSCFGRELERSLAARLRRATGVPKVHMSGKNGPFRGDLAGELKARIAESFSMIVVVHDNYVDSGWCERELEYFRDEFGERGFQERLWVVAMSKPAMERVARSADWRRIVPCENLLWLDFFEPDSTDQPVSIYLDNGPISDRFWKPFVRLREDLAGSMKACLDAPAPQAATSGGDGVFIYIEVNENEVEKGLAKVLGERIRRMWDEVANEALPALSPPLFLRPKPLALQGLDTRPRLDDADGVVLLWGRKTQEALEAQINKVESKLSGRDLPPGIVAYLMPPHQTEHDFDPWGWKVLRFDADPADAVDVQATEEDGLKAFLRTILERAVARRHVSAAP
jgi:TIR domain